jgi:hypothetical protein
MKVEVEGENRKRRMSTLEKLIVGWLDEDVHEMAVEG